MTNEEVKQLKTEILSQINAMTREQLLQVREDRKDKLDDFESRLWAQAAIAKINERKI